MLNSEGRSDTLKGAQSWPVTVVAVIFLLQGLSAGYSALEFAALSGDSVMSIAMFGPAALNSIVSVALIVAGVGLLARIKPCLAVAVILAGLYLFAAGSLVIEALFGPTATPLAAVAATAFVVVGWLQYVILRSKSTRSLFYPVAADQ